MSGEQSYKYILFDVDEGVTRSADETMAKEMPLFAWVGSQVDAVEGVKSFLERRSPDWKLRPSVDLPEWPAD